jgi:hypothetical protein
MSIMTYADKLHAKFAIFTDAVRAKAELTFPADQASHFVSGYVQSFMISMIASGMPQKGVLSSIDECVKYLRADVENGVSF